MAFDVRFIIYIDTEFVTQVVELVALRIVAKTDGINIVLLHQFEVLAHQLFGHVVAGCRVVFVDVHTFQLDRLAVDEEADVRLAVFTLFFDFLDFETTETYLIRNHFSYLITFLQCDEELVKVRMFRSPSLDIFNLSFKIYILSANTLAALSYYLALCVKEFIRSGSTLRFCYVYRQLEKTVLVSIVQSRNNQEVLYVSLRL